MTAYYTYIMLCQTWTHRQIALSTHHINQIQEFLMDMGDCQRI